MQRNWTAYRQEWQTAGTETGEYRSGSRRAWRGATSSWYWSADYKDPCGTTHGPYASADLAVAACDANDVRPHSGRGAR
jgi:hypothetical protein